MSKSRVMRLTLPALAAGMTVGVPVARAQVTEQGEQGGQVPAVVEPTPERDGIGYPVGDLRFGYAFAHGQLPDVSAFDDIIVVLSPTEDGYVGAVEGGPLVMVRLGDVSGPARVFYGSAVATITAAVRDYLEQEVGLIGHLVTPDPADIDFEGSRDDLRGPGDAELGIIIWRAQVGSVRTIAFGQERVDEEEGVNLPRHQRIRDRIVVRPGDVLRRPPIDDQVHRLNRHPGRRVDVAIAPTGEPGEVSLDYLITEAKSWAVYAQASNTGTEATDDWQYRFGYFNNQLTGRDDIFSVDYITSGFDESHAVLASYSFPLGNNDIWRARVFGRWSEYTASDVGIFDQDFRGEGWEAGAEVSANLFQVGATFVDVFGGARWEYIETDNELAAVFGEEDFFLPYLGARLERVTPLSVVRVEGRLEHNLDTVADTDPAGLVELGRSFVTESFTTFQASASASLFLEPLLNPAGFRGDRDPDEMTLAHELALLGRVQYAFGDRLVPNFQEVAGGAFTVRGYDESIVAGDDLVLATAEYRFHIGRAVPQTQQVTTLFGRPFRTARTQPYGSADWDVILKAFVDAARVEVNDPDPFENNETLASVGVGIEGQLKNNVTVRLDYGHVLSPVDDSTGRRADVGDGRLHFVATLLF